MKKADDRNELMDRFGGGPVKWSEFYGKTAEKFFYHPVDQSTSYHTITLLTQQHSMPDQTPGKVAAGQGVPLSQRPPQFDYIYRANQDAKDRAEKEATELRSKHNALVARRKALEEDQKRAVVRNRFSRSLPLRLGYEAALSLRADHCGRQRRC